MKTIAIYNNKGGCSKTVTAVNFSYNLSVLGYRVLLIDMDPQGNASSFYRRYDLNKPSVKELLTGEKAPSRCVRRTIYENLDIIPANVRLREVRPDNLVGGIKTLSCSSLVHEPFYDFCIIDCAPGVDFLIEVVMEAADEVIIPIKPDRFSAEGLGTALDIIREYGHGCVEAGCVFTQFYRNRDTLKTVKDILNTQDVRIYNNIVRRSSFVDHSVLVRRPLGRCASKSKANLDYMDFTKEFLEKEGAKDGIA
ncbi:MAG: ParA family protein [Eubacteriales bacterium]|nr:ParA family protein [Eubacteriales bacterium]